MNPSRLVFDALPRVTRLQPPERARQRALAHALHTLLPQARSHLATHLASALRFDLLDLRYVLPHADDLAQLDLAWHNVASLGRSRLLLGLDPAAAHALAALVLERPADPARLLRPLTPLEDALLTGTLAAACADPLAPWPPLALALHPPARGQALLRAAASGGALAAFTLHLGAASGTAWLLLPPDLLRLLPVAASRRADHATLPITLHLLLASLPVTPRALQRIAPGALLLTPLPAPADARCEATLGPPGAPLWATRLRLDAPRTLRLLHRLPHTPEVKAMTPPEPGHRPSTLDPAELAHLPVVVHLRVARWTLPLDELAHLQPGDLLDLPLREDHIPVTLAVGDRDLAVGELVNAEGQLAVRILRVLPAHTPPDDDVAPPDTAAL